ncbi:MAG: DedA family protein [bacterium]|nr:DedA family protein [bacterium]
MNADAVVEWMRGLPEWGMYAFLCISSAIENIFPPWPGDVPIVFAGFLAAHEVLTLPGAFVASLIGNLLSGLFMYYAGTYVLYLVYRIRLKVRRPAFVRRWLGGVFSRRQMDQTRDWFRRWGAGFVLISRFLAGIRIFVVVVAGITRMNLALFLLAFTAGVSVWNVLLLGGGYALGENWEQILSWIKIYSTVVISLLTVGVGGYIFWRLRKLRSAES